MTRGRAASRVDFAGEAVGPGYKSRPPRLDFAYTSPPFARRLLDRDPPLAFTPNPPARVSSCGGGAGRSARLSPARRVPRPRLSLLRLATSARRLRRRLRRLFLRASRLRLRLRRRRRARLEFAQPSFPRAPPPATVEIPTTSRTRATSFAIARASSPCAGVVSGVARRRARAPTRGARVFSGRWRDVASPWRASRDDSSPPSPPRRRVVVVARRAEFESTLNHRALAVKTFDRRLLLRRGVGKTNRRGHDTASASVSKRLHLRRHAFDGRPAGGRFVGGPVVDGSVIGGSVRRPPRRPPTRRLLLGIPYAPPSRLRRDRRARVSARTRDARSVAAGRATRRRRRRSRAGSPRRESRTSIPTPTRRGRRKSSVRASRPSDLSKRAYSSNRLCLRPSNLTMAKSYSSIVGSSPTSVRSPASVRRGVTTDASSRRRARARETRGAWTKTRG